MARKGGTGCEMSLWAALRTRYCMGALRARCRIAYLSGGEGRSSHIARTATPMMNRTPTEQAWAGVGAGYVTGGIRGRHLSAAVPVS